MDVGHLWHLDSAWFVPRTASALKATCLLSVLQMKIASLEMNWNWCDIWERFGWRSFGVILSSLRCMMLLCEELACLHWVHQWLCLVIPMSWRFVMRASQLSSCYASCYVTQAFAMTSFVICSSLSWATFFTSSEWHGQCQKVSGESWLCESVTSLGPMLWHLALCPIWGVAMICCVSIKNGECPTVKVDCQRTGWIPTDNF